jgi:predicted unusual protein kinase regulating ubiquinone biosynthesis (AarF/ABC1/UbiB family)
MSQKSIPVGKVARASRFVSTGAKVGVNYVKHAVRTALGDEESREQLDRDNARDIYQTLGELKGSALKMAQMLASDKHVLPTAYVEEFRKAQYKAPALSGPLIVQVFRKSLGKSPSEIFDSFEMEACNAASIGQVHRASKDGKKLAVKIQYPGVADSIISDLNLVKPFALRLLNIKEADIKPYFDEVQVKLMEESDYALELKNSIYLAEACSHLPDLRFPSYYADLSSDRVLTMDWVEGTTLSEWVLENHSQELRNRIGQALWGFYDFQMHSLRLLHADPHPGNFLVTPDGKLGVLDFGCTKDVPESFYKSYFAMLNPDNLLGDEFMAQTLKGLQIINEESSVEEKRYFSSVFSELLGLLRRPFDSEVFDFGDNDLFLELNQMGERLSRAPEARKFGAARGSKHILYVNKTYFGLFQLLHQLGAVVNTRMSLAEEGAV